MPVPTPTQQVVRVEMRHQLHSNAVWNVLHLVRDDILDPLQLQTEASNFAAEWGSVMTPTMSAEVTMPEIAIQQIWPDIGVLQVVPVPNVNGQISGDALPNQVALVLSLQSIFPGRRARGRMYLGGYPEANFDGSLGIFPSTFANGRATNLVSWQGSAGVDGAGWEQVVWSFASAVPPLPQYYPISTVIGRIVPGVIRSRRLGVGI